MSERNTIVRGPVTVSWAQNVGTHTYVLASALDSTTLTATTTAPTETQYEKWIWTDRLGDNDGWENVVLAIAVTKTATGSATWPASWTHAKIEGRLAALDEDRALVYSAPLTLPTANGGCVWFDPKTAQQVTWGVLNYNAASTNCAFPNAMAVNAKGYQLMIPSAVNVASSPVQFGVARFGYILRLEPNAVDANANPNSFQITITEIYGRPET